jgi:two-component system, NarL family, nitrate/nitrite response regulator NarL
VSDAAVVRVLVVDHDRARRAGVGLALEGQGFEICAEADSAEAAMQAALRERPELCLVEIDIPGGGIAAAELLLAELPGTAVVMLSATVDEAQLFAALRSGARGYLLKDMSPKRLPAALHGVLDGEAALPRSLMGAVLDEFHARERGRHANQLSRLGVELTNRERQVLELLDSGHPTAAIAERLSISVVTVRRHVSEILRKLGAPDLDSALRLVRGSDA